MPNLRAGGGGGARGGDDRRRTQRQQQTTTTTNPTFSAPAPAPAAAAAPYADAEGNVVEYSPPASYVDTMPDAITYSSAVDLGESSTDGGT